MSFVRAFVRRGCCTAAILSFIVPALSAHAADKKTKDAATETPSYYGPQPATENLDLTMYARIREEGFEHSHAMELAAALTDGIGPRLTGSPNMAKANAWTRDTLTKLGLENAHLEDWGEFGLGWQQINTWARMISPDPEPLWMEASPWSPATKGSISGEIVYVPLTDEKDLDKLKGTLAGKIVLLGTMRATPDLTLPLSTRYTDQELKEIENSEGGPQLVATPSPATLERRRLFALKQKAVAMMTTEGVAAIITPSRDGRDGGGTGIIFDDNGADLVRGAQKPENAVKIPNGVMMIEHYNRLARMSLAHVPVTVELNIETKFTGEHEHGFNTVAEIPGTDPKLKDEIVMVGGHLDSWIAGTGATDNGAGAIAAMEAVRILKALDVHPRRTIRIALWSGEEEGEFGSDGYVKQHFGDFAPPATPDPPNTPGFMSHHGALHTTKDWEKLDAYYNLDNGAGKIRGVYAQSNFAVMPIFKQWIAPLSDIFVTVVTPRDTGSTDHEPFDHVGLAGFEFLQDPLDYETRSHHSNMDTYDRLHAFDLEQAAVVEAIFLYNTSERDAMLPRKPFPHPEKEKELTAPIPGIYPNAAPPEPAAK
jgi:carboxypeptidase Q